MSKLARLTAEQRSDLIAYLDGELDEQQSHAIEQTLASSEVARHEVAAFTGTWQLLDYLPQETASEEFTARTLETVKLLVDEKPAVWWPKIDRMMLVLGWSLWLLATAVLGYTAGHRWLPQPSDPLIKDLPLLEQMELYRDVGSVDFLEALQRQGAVPAGGKGTQ